MVSKLKYEPHLDKAMRFIFGKTLICRNLEIATTISKQSMLDCITIDGDQVNTFYVLMCNQLFIYFIKSNIILSIFLIFFFFCIKRFLQVEH